MIRFADESNEEYRRRVHPESVIPPAVMRDFYRRSMDTLVKEPFLVTLMEAQRFRESFGVKPDSAADTVKIQWDARSYE